MNTIRLTLVLCLLISPPLLAAEPDPAGLTAAIDEIVRSAMKERLIPGVSVVVARGERILVAKGYGHADLENDVLAGAGTVYRIGSITKQFTAAAVLKLVDHEKLKLDDEISGLVPIFPTKDRKVTVRHLLTHTSGIPSYTGLGEEWRSKVRLDLTHEELLGLVSTKPFEFEPGEKFSYSNTGYYLLGLVIEKVTGKKYDEYLAEVLFEPLGLTGTSYGWHKPIIKNRARGYAAIDGKIINCRYLSMHQPYSAGALLSTVEDLVRWTRALHHGKVVSADSYREMITPATLSGAATTRYGFGLAVMEFEGRKVLAHGGGIFGFASALSYYPEEDLTIAVLTNSSNAAPATIEQDIARKVIAP